MNLSPEFKKKVLSFKLCFKVSLVKKIHYKKIHKLRRYVYFIFFKNSSYSHSCNLSPASRGSSSTTSHSCRSSSTRTGPRCSCGGRVRGSEWEWVVAMKTCHAWEETWKAWWRLFGSIRWEGECLRNLRIRRPLKGMVWKVMVFVVRDRWGEGRKAIWIYRCEEEVDFIYGNTTRSNAVINHKGGN